MITYLIRWNDGTMEILQALTRVCLFDHLDEIGNPFDAEFVEFDLPIRFTLAVTSKEVVDEVDPSIVYTDTTIQAARTPFSDTSDAFAEGVGDALACTQRWERFTAEDYNDYRALCGVRVAN